MIDITHALQSLRPGSNWSILGGTYQGLQWLDKTQTPPTEEEINAEIARLQTEYNNTQYQRDRAPEYPDLAEFADAYYWAQKGDMSKMESYIQKCDEVKEKYPKPESN